MKSKDLLGDFTKYCHENPELRFWQALRSWCGWGFVLVSRDFRGLTAIDTFNWNSKDGSS